MFQHFVEVEEKNRPQQEIFYFYVKIKRTKNKQQQKNKNNNEVLSQLGVGSILVNCSFRDHLG